MDAAVAERAIASIEAGRLGHDQGGWVTFMEDPDEETGTETVVSVSQLREGFCGSAACLAGHVAVNEAPAESRVNSDILFLPDRDVSIEEYSNEKLGISFAQGMMLYSAANPEVIPLLRFLMSHPGVTPQAMRDERDRLRRERTAS